MGRCHAGIAVERMAGAINGGGWQGGMRVDKRDNESAIGQLPVDLPACEQTRGGVSSLFLRMTINLSTACASTGGFWPRRDTVMDAFQASIAVGVGVEEIESLRSVWSLGRRGGLQYGQ